MKFKNILIIAAIIFAIIPMAIYSAVSIIFLNGNSEEQFSAEVSAMAANQISSIEAVIGAAKSDLDTIAGADDVKSAASAGAASESAKKILNTLKEENSLLTSAKLIDASGKVVAGTDVGSTVPNFSEYASYSDDALYFDVPSGKMTSSEGPTMFIKRKIGSCTLMLNYDIAGEDSLLARICDNSKFYDAGGSIIVDSKGAWSIGTGINTDFGGYLADVNSKISTLADGSVSSTFNYTDKDVYSLAAAAKAGGENGLASVVNCPANKGGNFARNSATPFIVVSIILAVAAIIGAVIMSGAVTKPLNNIEKTINVIKNGDHEARIRNMSTNEYGQLSKSFNNLVDEIVVSEDRYKNISEMSDNIIFEWNFKTNEVVFSNNFNKKFSYRAPSNHFGDSFLLKAKVHPDDIDRYRHDIEMLEKGTNFERNEYRIKNIYGDFIWVLMRTATLKDNSGKAVKAVGVMVDIDRAKKSEQQLTERASFDALTELYNRETIENQIDNEISLSEMRKSEMAVLFIDVDDFKHFNDDYSHATGDQVLKFVAKTIKTAVEGIGFAGRYGGDEFIAMLRNAETNEPALFAQNIISRLAEGFEADIGERISVSVSIGIALIQDDYNTRVEYLIGKADDAMYSVKKSGKSNYAFI